MFERVLKLIVIILFLLSILIACYYAYTYPPESIHRTLAIGAIGSLIASLFYGMLMFVLVKESAEDKKRFLERLKELEKRDLQGIRHIRAKNEFAPDYWVSLLNTAATVLDLSGHALSQWCEEPYRPFFIATLKRVAANGKVRILLMNPSGETHRRRQNLVGVSYRDRIQTTLTTIQQEVIAKLDPLLRKNINIKWNSDAEFHNVFIRTDNTVLVSPYLSTMNSRDAIQLIFDPKEKFGAMYLNDFEKLFSLSQEIP
ncbi:MAG: hypothetical protein WC454_08280 [Phycisphaerae bacterium]|jgi:hypothetical protein